jgi:hypothetical protein
MLHCLRCAHGVHLNHVLGRRCLHEHAYANLLAQARVVQARGNTVPQRADTAGLQNKAAGRGERAEGCDEAEHEGKRADESRQRRKNISDILGGPQALDAQDAACSRTQTRENSTTM